VHGAYLSSKRAAKEVASLQGSNMDADEAKKDNH
jgi:hypothetical protein